MPDNSLSNKRIAKNSIFLSIRMVIVLGISLYTTRIVLRVLGVVDFGVYNVVCGFVTMFSFLNTSMSNGIQRFFNYEYGRNGEEGANRVFCTSLYIQAFLALAVVIIIEVFGLWYLHNKMVIPMERQVAAEWIFQFAVISFVLGIMQAPFSAAVTAHEQFNFYALVGILDAVLKLVIVLILDILPLDNLVLYGLFLSLVNLIDFLLFVIYSINNFAEIKFQFKCDRELFNGMLGFSGWNLLGSFSGVMKEQGINLVLNAFFGPVVNAARGVASQINSGIQGFVGNILTPVRPQVVQSYARGDVLRSLYLTYSISKLSSCFFLMMAIPAALEISYLLKIWLGDNIPDYTATFTIIILATSLIYILNGAISTVVHATGIMKEYQLYGSLIGVASVPIAYFLLKIFEMPEIALVAVLICASLSHIIGLFIVRKIAGLSLRDYLREVIIPISVVLLSTLILTIPIHLFLHSGLIRFICVVLCSIFGILTSLYFFALKNSERLFVNSILKSFVSRLKSLIKHRNIC